MTRCVPGIMASIAVYAIIKGEALEEPTDLNLDAFTDLQLASIALADLFLNGDPYSERRWVAAFFSRDHAVPALSGDFTELMESDPQDLLRSSLAGFVMLTGGKQEDTELLFLIARERTGDRSPLVEYRALQLASGPRSADYDVWLTGELEPRMRWPLNGSAPSAG
jgi:hypothetical protein